MRNLEPDDLGLVTPTNRKILFHSSHRIPGISNRNIWSNGKRPLFSVKSRVINHCSTQLLHNMQQKAKALLSKNDAFSLYCLDFSMKIWLIFLILDKKTPSVKNLMNFHWLPKTFSRIVCKLYIFRCLLLYGKFQWHICSHIRGKEVALHLYRSYHFQTKRNRD